MCIRVCRPAAKNEPRHLPYRTAGWNARLRAGSSTKRQTSSGHAFPAWRRSRCRLPLRQPQPSTNTPGSPHLRRRNNDMSRRSSGWRSSSRHRDLPTLRATRSNSPPKVRLPIPTTHPATFLTQSAATAQEERISPYRSVPPRQQLLSSAPSTFRRPEASSRRTHNRPERSRQA